MRPHLRIIIAGGRDFTSYPTLRDYCDGVIRRYPDTVITIVSGAARGADELGEVYAAQRGYYLQRYPADWEQHDHRAGPIRNGVMANNADVLIAFWDGASRGTKDMIDQAHQRGLTVYVRRW